MLDYVRLGPFKIAAKISEITYRLNLPAKMKIYLIQHIMILEPAYKNIKLLVYKADMYKGQEEDK